MNVTLTGVERLTVVQLSHWKAAEITGEAKRKFSVSLMREMERKRESIRALICSDVQ